MGLWKPCVSLQCIMYIRDLSHGNVLFQEFLGTLKLFSYKAMFQRMVISLGHRKTSCRNPLWLNCNERAQRLLRPQLLSLGEGSSLVWETLGTRLPHPVSSFWEHLAATGGERGGGPVGGAEQRAEASFGNSLGRLHVKGGKEETGNLH